MAIRINPSILGADFVNLESELQRISRGDAVHVDVMDNHFVDALTFGLQTVKRIRDVSPIPLDVHLMIDNPDTQAAKYADVGAQSVTFHVEAAKDSYATAASIRSAGAQACVALKPSTPLEPYFDLFAHVDMILIMTVEPGAGGQKFMADQMPKLEQLVSFVRDQQLNATIQVDGGINRETLPIAYQRGAEVFVAGASVYGHGDPNENIQALRDCVMNER